MDDGFDEGIKGKGKGGGAWRQNHGPEQRVESRKFANSCSNESFERTENETTRGMGRAKVDHEEAGEQDDEEEEEEEEEEKVLEV